MTGRLKGWAQVLWPTRFIGDAGEILKICNIELELKWCRARRLIILWSGIPKKVLICGIIFIMHFRLYAIRGTAYRDFDMG